MSGIRWFASPLAGTAGVLLALGLISIPLRKLTSAAPVAAVRAATTAEPGRETPAVLRLKLLAPAKRVIVKNAAEKTLLELRDQGAGESEHDAMIALEDGGIDLTLHVELGESISEAAVFLTVMPDGYEDQTRYGTGTGMIEESLHYEWHTH